MATNGEVLLKTLANSKRMDILYQLAFHDEGARVSDLAQALGEAPNSVSYHVRELAKAGVVEKFDAPGGDARETWYRVAGEGIKVDSSTEAGGRDLGAVIEQLYDSVGNSSVVSRYRAAAANAPGGDDVVFGFQNVLRLTEGQKNELFAGLRSVLERAMSQNDEHKKRLADASEREETLQNTERVYVSIDYFPVIEQGE